MAIVFILYLTVKEILKKTSDSFVLKDQYTIYFVTLTVISLIFKITIIDTQLKEETSFKNSCSMFLSTFVPEFFLNLAYTCMAIKAVFLWLNIRDTKNSYNERNKGRLRVANVLYITYLSVLTAVMFLRCLNTCQREKVQWAIEDFITFMDGRELTILSLLLKTLSLFVFCAFLCLLRSTNFFTGKRHMLSISIAQALMTIGFFSFNLTRFLTSDRYWELNQAFSQFISPFFVDIFMVVMMMLTLLVMRQVEVEVLVELGVYKNVELMSDKEMFSEYEKLKKQSMKLQKRVRRAKRQARKDGSATNRNT